MNIVKKRRKELKIRQQDIENSIGITRERIGRLENGDLSIPLKDLKKLFSLLDISLEVSCKINGVKTRQKIF